MRLWLRFRRSLRFIRTWGFIGPTVAGMLVFFSTYLAPATKDDPTAGAGLSAALIAFCFAFTLILDPKGTENWWISLIRKLCMGVVALGGAYLWIASEAGLHPQDPELHFSISFLLILILAISFLVILLGTSFSGTSEG